MLTLSTTASVLRVVTGSAGTIDVLAAYVDVSTSTPAPSGIGGAIATPISTATTTTVVVAPSSGNVRTVKGLTVSNDHASVNNAIRVEAYDGTNAIRLWVGTLLFGERVVLDESTYWTVYGADGNVKAQGVNFGQVYGSTAVSNVAVPDAATLRVFGGLAAGRMSLNWVLPDGATRRVQERLSSSGFSAYYPNNGTTVGLNIGLGWTTGGTVSHPTPSNTSPALYNERKRTRWANVVTTANQVLGLRTATAEKRYWRGNASGLGGFNFHAQFAIGLIAAATTRLFVGLNDSNSGYVISDTLTGNGIGLWHDTTDAIGVLSLVVVNAGTAVKTGITLGANLAAGQMFDFEMTCDPNSSSVGYKLTDLTTGTVLVDSSITGSSLPLNTAFMGQELAMSNGTANTTVTTTAFELMAHQCHSNG